MEDVYVTTFPCHPHSFSTTDCLTNLWKKHGSFSMCPAQPPVATDALQLLLRDAIGFPQPGPGSGQHLLPRSCWDLVAFVEGQLLQTRRFAQDLEKICCATDTFALVAKAPGARWHRKDWTTKITNLNKTKWHCGRLWQLTPIYKPSKTLTNRTTSQVSPNVIYQQSSTLLMLLMSPMSPNKRKWEQQINFRKHHCVLCQGTTKNWQPSS